METQIRDLNGKIYDKPLTPETICPLKKSLKEKMKKINWELTQELHLDDGRHYGGAVWLYFHRDVEEHVKRALERITKDCFIGDVRYTRQIFKEEFGF